ncbi:FKBP-type peptidyl-prolyl cis-trans isomerase [Mucilaginibacter sp. X4EP1]|uniref:FKBP-type peptidyl-prolyl cis-trans isomerase n=1 Tax=Mucilaginibacter sp. X4EP1 TaxID=2723092 RepID=UPI002169F27D|nr:FKBP-type peptidyl-prolyl cis-trans isomerase [Mucilaginibacter sp. X4EP1]MCS3814254.1 FKBP-type peptidyl-prolyl cis-trans isomerase [Mucilaginibacter sp. X4EP1]
MKYILFILALTLVVKANAQTELQHTPKGAAYQIFTHNTGDKIKLNDVITFEFIQKTDKDSVLFSTYAAGHPVQAQIQASQNVGDLMEVFPLLTVSDSALVKVPTDSIFAGHEDQRPAFFPKGSYLNFILKIEKVQSLDAAIAEKNAAVEKVKATEVTEATKYIADHKLVLKTTPSGLKYIITKPSLKRKVLKGDTVLVNYAGRTLDDKVFDSSIAAVAQASGLNQPGRTYEPIQVIVGTGGVIPGWDEGLLLLNEGTKATFVIPSALAYGAQGAGDDIKPYNTLVFDVEVVKLKPIKHPVAKKPLAKKKPVAKKAS